MYMQCGELLLQYQSLQNFQFHTFSHLRQLFKLCFRHHPSPSRCKRLPLPLNLPARAAHHPRSRRSCAVLLDEAALRAWLTWGREQSLPVRLLGGDSNTLVVDASWPGLVVQFTADDWRYMHDGDEAPLNASLASLSRRGAGTKRWGQESERHLGRCAGHGPRKSRHHHPPRRHAGLGYRDARWCIHKHVVGPLRHHCREPLRAGVRPRHPEIAESSKLVFLLRWRRCKSMVYDAADPNHCSFFTNPIVPKTLAASLCASLGDGMEILE